MIKLRLIKVHFVQYTFAWWDDIYRVTPAILMWSDCMVFVLVLRIHQHVYFTGVISEIKCRITLFL